MLNEAHGLIDVVPKQVFGLAGDSIEFFEMTFIIERRTGPVLAWAQAPAPAA
jgi:hypothetical protein